MAVPPTQLPPWQASACVQALPSLQALPSSFWQAPVALQARQVPHPLLEQQKPSVQNRLAAHWSVVAHGAPAGFLPHTFPTHVFGETQSLFVVHVSLQAVVPLHMNGAQAPEPPPTLQLPLPLQVLASVTVDEPAGQAGGAHGVPAWYLRHWPLPSHLPSLPHVEVAVTPHRPLASAMPAGRGEHVPGVALSVHDTQTPSQAALQQTFCAEQTRPDAHSLLAAHAAPFGLRPHEPLMQTALGAQSALAVHVDWQTSAPQLKGKQEVAAGVLHLPAPSHVD
jgi:hypothetical protein